ncbi:MAG: hypothetical protein ACF8NJ_08545 [Phycisphaerales bacterium JB038]
MPRLIALVLLCSGCLLVGCGDDRPIFDEDAWYDREVDENPTGWAVGDWLYRYDGQIETLSIEADGRYIWRLQLPWRDPVADVGEWSGDRGVIELVSDVADADRVTGPPAQLIRVPTSTGVQLLTPNLLRQWRQAGFEAGGTPRAGQAFRKVERD